jgi:hypothetical protein
VLREDTRTAQLVFRQALIARGRPSALYVDYADDLVMPTFPTPAVRRSLATSA